MTSPTSAFRALAGVAVLTLALAGCSGGTSSAPQDAPTAGQGPSGRAGGGQRQPGVSGKIAARSGSTLQVQGSTEQTAVTWTSTTRFTELSTSTAAALKVGLCAVVRPADDASAPVSTTVAAASVTLSPAVDGECTGGLGGARPSGAPSGVPSGGPTDAPPTDAPSGVPSGGPGQGGGLRGADGKVTSVDGTSFVVAARQPGGTTTTDVTVTTNSSTTWSLVATASASAAKVGRCALAQGSTSGTGALTATSIRLSSPSSDGTCAAGFGGRGQGNGQPDPGASPNG